MATLEGDFIKLYKNGALFFVGKDILLVDFFKCFPSRYFLSSGNFGFADLGDLPIMKNPQKAGLFKKIL